MLNYLNNRLVNHLFCKNKLIFTSFCLILLTGCENQKYTQCQEIIAIANQVTQELKALSINSTNKDTPPQTWLKAAEKFKNTGQAIQALVIKDPQLVDYQNNLANIFLTYSESTYEAVEARKQRNKSILQIARDKAQNAGKRHQNLVDQINDHCLSR